MSQNTFQLNESSHAKAMHLLDEIKRQSGALTPENAAASGNVIHALAESIMWVLVAAVPVDVSANS